MTCCQVPRASSFCFFSIWHSPTLNRASGAFGLVGNWFSKERNAVSAASYSFFA